MSCPTMQPFTDLASLGALTLPSWGLSRCRQSHAALMALQCEIHRHCKSFEAPLLSQTVLADDGENTMLTMFEARLSLPLIGKPENPAQGGRGLSFAD